MTSVVRVNLLGFLLYALTLFGAGLLAHQQLVSEEQEATHGEMGAHLTEQAARLSGLALGWRDMLARLAKSEPLREALAADEDVWVASLLEATRRLLPGALRLQVVTPEQINPDDLAIPPLSYSCLDLVRQAEAGAEGVFEVHHYENAPAHIDVVWPIRETAAADAPVLGTLLLTFDQASAQKWLQGAYTGSGYLELRQQVGENEFVTLASVGNSDLKHDGLHTVRKVDGTAWQLESWDSTADTNQLNPGDGYYYVFGLALIPLVLITLFLTLMLRRLYHADLVRLAQLGMRIGAGERSAIEGFGLRESDATARALFEHRADQPERRAGPDRNAMTERQAWEKEQQEKKLKGKRSSDS